MPILMGLDRFIAIAIPLFYMQVFVVKFLDNFQNRFIKNLIKLLKKWSNNRSWHNIGIFLCVFVSLVLFFKEFEKMQKKTR